MDIFIIYGLTAIALIIVVASQGYIKSAYSKYSKIQNKKGMTGKEAARLMLDKNDLKNVKIEEVQGYLSDHYDPKTKTVRLSSSNYHDASIAAVAVACHECGHAIQDKKGYLFLRIRHGLVPFVNLATKLGYLAIVIGIIAQIIDLIWLGIIFELVILLFQLVTLPVEFNASSRALKKIKEYSILDDSEYKQGRTMLTAAALTYVASVASTLIEIVRLILMFTRRD